MRRLRRQANAFRTRVLGPVRSQAITMPPAESGLTEDLRLFILTFGGGFLFMTIYLA
jgi:hypothetical protein